MHKHSSNSQTTVSSQPSECKSSQSKKLLESNQRNFSLKKKTSPPSSPKIPPKERASKFAKYFSEVVSSLKKSSFKLKNLVWNFPSFLRQRTTSSFRFTYVSVVFVRKQLKALKRKKATGLDQLPSALLKDSADEISKPLAHIINLSLNSSSIPTTWKRAKVIPVFKSGNADNVSSYRPISVLPILSKIMEKAVFTQLIEYLEINKLLTNCQFGYRSKRSTESAATLFVDDIRKQVEQGKLVGAVFMDLSKAFDTVGHAILIEKLKCYGVYGSELSWFGDYLFNRTQVVEIDQSYSDPHHLLSGVPQGSILGPLLFLIYFNDLPDCLTVAKVIMYADDTVVYYASDTIDRSSQF